MASRAHVIHDYSSAGPAPRQRRVVRFRTEDPVVLPQRSLWSTGGGVIATALAVGALVVGGVYTVSHREPATLGEIQAAPLADNYEPSEDFTRANVIKALGSPLYAVRDLAVPGGEVDLAPQLDVPATAPLGSHDAVIDDSAPGAQDQFPQTAPDLRTPAAPTNATPDRNMTPVVPNPATTPPDAIAPGKAAPNVPTPAFDSENPYR